MTPARIAIASALAAALVLPAATQAQGNVEKCYGVAKAGKNDCASSGNNSCAGHSAKDADPGAWLLVPAGLCEKLTGGSLEPKA